MTNDWTHVFAEIEDRLFPQLRLSVWEKVLYYHLLRHTRITDTSRTTISIASLATATSMSDSTVRDALRSLDQKGSIVIHERSGKGHSVEVRLPSDIPNLVASPPAEEVLDINRIDFYSDRSYLGALLEREGYRCFYSLREVTKDTCVLDHVVPLVNGGNNSYRNVVVASHDVNALKQGQDAEEFLRFLFRKGMLSPTELEERMEALRLLKDGKLVPRL